MTRIAVVGTEAGVRRAAERLAAHGVCLTEVIGGRVVYTLNYDHVLYDAVTALLKADRELPRRLKSALAGWEPAPASAVLFGAARRDGDVGSDVDLLLVRPPQLTEARKREWVRQVHALRPAVLAAIAASDALCGRLLGERARGQDHRDAVDLLATVRFGEGNPAAQAKRARELAAALATVLDFKDEAHYGTTLLGPAQVRRLIKGADKLVKAAPTLLQL